MTFGLSAEERERRQARGRSLRTRGVDDFAKVEVYGGHFYVPHDGAMEKRVDMTVNGKLVHVIESGGRYLVEMGSSWTGDFQRSGWMSHAETNKFIHDNTKG